MNVPRKRASRASRRARASLPALRQQKLQNLESQGPGPAGDAAKLATGVASHPKGLIGKGEGAGDNKPRTVFFAARANETTGDHTAFMAYRTPFNVFGAAPHPTELRQGERWGDVQCARRPRGDQEDLDMMMLVSALGVSEYIDSCKTTS